LKDDNTIRKSMLKLVIMVQKLKNDKNRDDSLLFSWAVILISITGPASEASLLQLSTPDSSIS